MTSLAGLVQLLLLVLGVTSLLQASPMAFEALRWAGAAYLIWLGAKLLVGAGRHVGGASTTRPSRVANVAALREGLINNLTNPKAMVFLFAFLPQFIVPASSWSVTAQLLVLGTVTKLSNFMIMSTVALSAGAFGGWLARPGLIAWQERFSGLVMVSLGLRLAFAGDGRPARP